MEGKPFKQVIINQGRRVSGAGRIRVKTPIGKSGFESYGDKHTKFLLNEQKLQRRGSIELNRISVWEGTNAPTNRVGGGERVELREANESGPASTQELRLQSSLQ